ncbi:formylglycine-generating enzyme family protein [Kordiimonas sp. SCSIO 12610]|uniref:formylglycine-generating enzyme family protein n=1 Tax=Kordiimonas sp. SCSIO 12610 TaxID=2829597 RepID=UPI00210D58A6|nr:formylglycine-generating enzyme family protein [Kordiimonas sp. SCSIO 12610]UTW54030.1 formylglycine-generating enzyme family protein [Kordiimonas sp. SCSIO 12610]
MQPLFCLKSTLLTIVFLSQTVTAEEDKKHEAGDTFKDCEECPEMVVLPVPGTFNVGFEDFDEKKRRRLVSRPQEITINYQFAVGKFELLASEYDLCAREGACRPEASHSINTPKTNKYPVVGLSGNDAKDYVAWLSKKTGKPYRLLSATEWEFAAKGKTTTKYWWGDDYIPNMAICNDCTDLQLLAEEGVGITKSFTINRSSSKSIASEFVPYTTAGLQELVKPNLFGLYFMYGNAQEIVEDCFEWPVPALPTDGSAYQADPDCVAVITKGQSFMTLKNRINPTAVGPTNKVSRNKDAIDQGTRIALTISQ